MSSLEPVVGMATVSSHPAGFLRPRGPETAKTALRQSDRAGTKQSFHARRIFVTRASQIGRYRCSQWQRHRKEVPMFTELSEELLDLAVQEKGYRNALYAKTIAPGGSSSCTGSSSSLTCCKLSW